MLNILIMGAGAIGGFVGSTLAAAGHTVTLLGRPAPMQRIAAEGLSLAWPDQPARTVVPNTVSDVSELADSAFDFVLLTVKSPATKTAARQLAPLLAESRQTCMVSLQNGIGNEETLAQIVGAERVIAGTITIPIQTPAPGAIEVSKAKGGIGLAATSAGQPVEALAAALNQAGLPTQTYADFRAMKWSKLLLNIVNNAASAILDEPPAQIIRNPALFNLEIRALAEGAAVMRALGVPAVNLPGYPAKWLARLVSAGWLPLPAKRAILRPFMVSGRGTKMPSLHIDLSSGRTATEIDALNGAIVAAGQKTGVPTPANRALTDTLNGITAGQLDWQDFRHRPDRLLEQVKAEKQGVESRE